MKLLPFALTIFQVFASEASEAEEAALLAEGVDPKKFSGIVRMINSQINTSLDYQTIVKRIQNYGCHCFPGMSRAAGGQGAPVDDMDSACHTLFKCHRCVDMDHNNACDVDAGKYRFSIRDGEITCNGDRNSDCQQNQCQCDKEFALTMGQIWDDDAYNFHYWLARNNVRAMENAGTPVFDFADTCQNSQSNSTPDSCCGEYPHRRPFSSVMMECCDDGSIGSVGSC